MKSSIKRNSLFYYYSLADPISGEIAYIGRTTQPKVRFSQHLSSRKSISGNRYKNSWIMGLAGLGEKPVMSLINPGKEDSMTEWNMILAYWEKGHPLLNRIPGPRLDIWENRIVQARYYQRSPFALPPTVWEWAVGDINDMPTFSQEILEDCYREIFDRGGEKHG